MLGRGSRSGGSEGVGGGLVFFGWSWELRVRQRVSAGVMGSAEVLRIEICRSVGFGEGLVGRGLAGMIRTVEFLRL